MTMSKRVQKLSILAAGAVAALGASAFAASLNRVAIIDIPGNKLEQFDIGYVDLGGPLLCRRPLECRGRHFRHPQDDLCGTGRRFRRAQVQPRQASRHRARADPTASPSIRPEARLWAADGDSTVKVIDVAANPPKIVATINTGGQKRADELGIDTKDGVVLVGNNADKPSYVTFISTKPDHAILAKVEMPDASDGIDQPLYVPETGLFYASVPIWKEDKNHGGLAVLDPKTFKMTKLIPIDDCGPLGLAQGPGTKVIVGCSAGSKARTPTMPTPATVIIDVATEKVVKVIHELGGQDEVWYNPTARQYYTASRDMPTGPVLGVINADTDTFVESIATGENAHSVAADLKNNAIFVPLTAPNPACPNGCIGVYQIKQT